MIGALFCFSGAAYAVAVMFFGVEAHGPAASDFKGVRGLLGAAVFLFIGGVATRELVGRALGWWSREPRPDKRNDARSDSYEGDT